MNDMTPVIVPKSDQISSDDFIGGPKTYRIESVDIRPGTEQPVSIFMVGEERAFKPCKSMSRVFVAAWGPDAKLYVGRSVTLYRDPKVKWGGLEVGGIRISHMSDIDREIVMALTATKGKRTPYSVKPLAAQSVPSELTLDQARSDIEFAADLDELKAIWTRKSMAPFRADLQADLDARKAALAEPVAAPATETNACDDLIARVEACTVIADVLALEESYQKARADMFDVPEQDRIEAAIDAAKAALKTAKP